MVTFTWPRKRFLLAGMFAVVFGFIVLVVVQFGASYFQPGADRVPTIFKGGTAYLRVAETNATRQKGLSGVEKMRSNEGMLFEFPNDQKWGIWMKDMKIPIDIIWLTKDRKVVYIVRDAKPELKDTKTFTPNEPARYVIELNAGGAARYMVNVGDIVEFKR